MTVAPTACTYDCQDACALLVEYAGGRLTIRGDPGHPITRGFVCQRVRRHAQRLSDPGRITTPRRRREHGWQEMAWEDALDLAAEKLAAAVGEYGPASVMAFTTGGSLGLRKKLVGHFFRSLGPVTTLKGGVCDEAGTQPRCWISATALVTTTPI